MFGLINARLLVAFLPWLPVVSSYSQQAKMDISEAGTFETHRLRVLDHDRVPLMRRARRDLDIEEHEGEISQVPRATTTSTLFISLAGKRPNEQLCICNGCLQSDGYCKSIWHYSVPTARNCQYGGGTWCRDKSTNLWEAPEHDGGQRCRLSSRSSYSEKTLDTLNVKLIPLSSEGNGIVKFEMIENDNGESSIGLLPCTYSFPDIILNRNRTLVTVQGYYSRVQEIFAQPEIPEILKNSTTVFIILNVQDNDAFVADTLRTIGGQVIAGSLEGALKSHWSSQMSIAVALVTCPGTKLNADPEKVKKAFFYDVANALNAEALGQIVVSGGITKVEIPCPSDLSKSDVDSYFRAVDNQLASDPIWTRNQYKAMVIPNGWMAGYGLAYSPGNLSWYTDLGGQDAANIMHEIGHNLGLDHASIIPSDNPTGYDENGDCSSAMSRCARFFTYTLASSWFLGFNTFQQTISIDALTRPVTLNIIYKLQQKASGVLLTRSVKGMDVPTFTVSIVPRKELGQGRTGDAKGRWPGKVYIHKLPETAYGPTQNIAFFGLQRRFFHIPSFPVAVAVTSLHGFSATVTICKVTSTVEAQKCGK
jgi:hypothetical protein